MYDWLHVVYACVLLVYISMVVVIMHEVMVYVVIWSCIHDWTLARMMAIWLYAYVLYFYMFS